MIETKQLLIIVDNIQKFAMILYQEEFEHLTKRNSEGSVCRN